MMSNRFGANGVGAGIRWATLAAIAIWSIFCGYGTAVAETAAPNIVLILTDDQGYRDVGCFGAQGFQTPHLDRLAREGRRFTDFYVAASVCTASRAALMTGCYPNRVSMFGALNHTSREGIHPDELLLPEILQTQGYATACYGKWHLGTVVEFFPRATDLMSSLGYPIPTTTASIIPLLPTCRRCRSTKTRR